MRSSCEPQEGGRKLHERTMCGVGGVCVVRRREWGGGERNMHATCVCCLDIKYNRSNLCSVLIHLTRIGCAFRGRSLTTGQERTRVVCCRSYHILLVLHPRSFLRHAFLPSTTIERCSFVNKKENMACEEHYRLRRSLFLPIHVPINVHTYFAEAFTERAKPDQMCIHVYGGGLHAL